MINFSFIFPLFISFLYIPFLAVATLFIDDFKGYNLSFIFILIEIGCSLSKKNSV
jgi:hypothetical protein